MTKPNRDKMIETIQKLMEVTEDNKAFENEIAVASAKIQALMEKYSIAWGEILGKKEEDLTEKFESAAADSVLYNTLAWNWSLARVIARVTHTKHYRTKVYSEEPVEKETMRYNPGYKKQREPIRNKYRTMAFYGEPANAELAARLFSKWLSRVDLMSLEARKLYSKKVKAGEIDNPVDPRVYRRSWLKGCLDAMMKKVLAQEEERATQAEKAMVLYDDRVEAAYEEFSKGFGKVNVNGGRQLSFEGLMDGAEIGEQINVAAEKLKEKV